MNRIIGLISIALFFLAGCRSYAADRSMNESPKEPELIFSDPIERFSDGNGEVEIRGDLRQWHKVTLILDGPFAHELDNNPNPFTDYQMTVVFRHSSGLSGYTVPGYFAGRQRSSGNL